MIVESYLRAAPLIIHNKYHIYLAHQKTYQNNLKKLVTPIIASAISIRSTIEWNIESDY